MSRKRERSPELEEFLNLASVMRVSPNVKVQGVITKLSKMIPGQKCNYFDGELADGKSKVCVFGFDLSACRKLAEFYSKGERVSLGKCLVRNSMGWAQV